jgi:hypothetical protein
MTIKQKLGIKDIYEYFPDSQSHAGDIWENLPTFGLLHQQSAKGIVITPACDLANRKTETITYLPIVPCSLWLLSRANRSEQLRAIKGQIQAAAVDCPEWLAFPRSGSRLSREDCTSLACTIGSVVENATSAKTSDAAKRALAGMQTLIEQCTAQSGVADTGKLALLYGEKQYKDILSQVVRNSYRPDAHFLPEDGLTAPMSAMPESSVVLFRYPLTLPIEIFEAASDVLRPNWLAEVQRITPQFPAIIFASSGRPLKLSRLKPRFLADLIARYIALHVRMGAPSFSDETVDSLVESIRDQK